MHTFAWQGKVFTRSPDGRDATLENKVTAAGVQLIVARVYETQSWIDGKPCIVLDYSKTSLFARKIRDEIRLIDEGQRLYNIIITLTRMQRHRANLSNGVAAV